MASTDISRPIITRKQAIALGLRRYFTGKPCKRNHLAERDIKTGCVQCRDERVRAWNLANPERRRATKLRWLEENRERDKEAKRAYAERNREHLRLTSKRYYQEHREYYRRWAAAWKVANLFEGRVYSQNTRARKLGAPGPGLLTSDYRLMLLQQECRCAYCSKEDDLVIDHIVPLSRGGLHAIANIVLCCRACNTIKSLDDLERFLTHLSTMRPGQWTATPADVENIIKNRPPR